MIQSQEPLDSPDRTTLETLKELVVEVAQMPAAPSTLPDVAHLFDDCGIDSTSIIDLILRVEDAFGIEVPEDELDAEVLRTLSTLAVYIDRKLRGVEPTPST